MNQLEIKNFLDEKVEQYQQPQFIETDPIQVPKQFTNKKDIEISAFLTSTIAWGNRASILKNGNYMMQLLEFEPYNFVLNASEKEKQNLLKFVHRTFNGIDLIYFLDSLKNIYINHNGLEYLFYDGFNIDGTVKSSLENFYQIFFEKNNGRTRKHISNVAKGSTGKRLNMFLRWMVRSGSVDFNLWNNIPPSVLMLPIDVHTGNVSRKLGLLKRKSNDWKAVEEITKTLRDFDREDPIKYDFALFGLGVFEKF